MCGLIKKILRQVWNCLSYIRLWQKTVKNPLYSENEIIEMQRQIGLSGSQIMKALAAKNLQINCSPVEAMKYAGAVSGKAKKEF